MTLKEVELLPLEQYSYNKGSDDIAYIYLIHTPIGFKIGKCQSLRSRIKMLFNEFNGNISIIHYYEVPYLEYDIFEKGAHLYFSDQNNGIRLEYFNLSEDHINTFKMNSFIELMKEYGYQYDDNKKRKLTIRYARKALKLKKKYDKLIEEANATKNKYNSEVRTINKQSFHDKELLKKLGIATIK